MTLKFLGKLALLLGLGRGGCCARGCSAAGAGLGLTGRAAGGGLGLTGRGAGGGLGITMS